MVNTMDPLTATLAPIHHTARLGDGTVHYWEYNSDKQPTIVVIHGYRGTHHGLERVIAHLPHYRFIVPDLPGFGKSEPLQSGAHNIEGYADAMAGFIRQLSLEGSIVLGHSMGSIVAAELAKTHPELMQSLILVNPIAAHPLKGASGLIVSPSVLYHWLGGRALPIKLGRKLLDSRAFLLFGSVLMAKTRDKKLRSIIHTNHLTHMTEYDNPAMLYEAYLGSLSGTVTDRAPHITVPTLLIAGDKDDLAPPPTQKRLVQQLPGAELVIIDRVGHLIHYETPGEAAEAIDQFIATRLRK